MLWVADSQPPNGRGQLFIARTCIKDMEHSEARLVPSTISNTKALH